ncbi:MAG: protein-disulfide reductase DsbD family protein [Betaproteobacteria bacterium]|jgi:thiol:disulfide interchange protein DsbD|nr:protein-disulfide reductase DsbD family protein [Betaproteobacteria bacterium]
MMASSIAGALAVAAVALALSASGGAAEPRLLEPERAFALSVQAVDEKTVEVRFVIANGYYLYREKMKFAVEPAVLAAEPQLPPGALKDDPFFGAVETYRDRFALRLPLAGVEPGRKVTVKAESQGCADVGVCYPPQVQSVTVTLPAPGGRPGAPVAATPARKSWFN